MKNLIFAVAVIFGFSASAIAQDYPDLSASYYLWRVEGSQMDNAIKDKKVTVTDKGGSLEIKYPLSGMQGGGSLSPYWATDYTMREQQKYTNVRIGAGNNNAYKWGSEFVEVEEGILVFGNMDFNLAGSGECANTGLEGITFILLRDESKKNTLSLSLIKAKVNELLELTCETLKSKTPEKKDLRGLSTVSGTSGTGGSAPDFSASKKLDGTYYTYRNPDVTAHYIYGDCATADIIDGGEQITINSKFMKVKKVAVTFHNDKRSLAIEKATGHKIMFADEVTRQYNFGDAILVEIEEGVLVIATYYNMDFTYESTCQPDVNSICYVFFKDKGKCESMALGEIKTKFKAVLTEMCQKYQKTLDAPKSSMAVVLPPHKNTDMKLEAQAWEAMKIYCKNMSWTETLIGSYIADNEWTPITKKEFINNSYIDVVIGRQRNCIIFYKTDRGIYKSEGLTIRQDAIAGDYSGKNFNTAVYVGGVLSGLPGSGWDVQIVEEKDLSPYKKQ